MDPSVIMVGAEATGKTSLCCVVTGRGVPEAHEPTVEDSFYWRPAPELQLGTRVALLDTGGGSEVFLDNVVSTCRDGAVFMFVFGLDRRDTFDYIKPRWKKICMMMEGKKFAVVLVGNKADREQKRKVSVDEATAVAVSMGGQYIETSAKNGTNVVEAFTMAAQLYREPEPQYHGTKMRQACAMF